MATSRIKQNNTGEKVLLKGYKAIGTASQLETSNKGSWIREKPKKGYQIQSALAAHSCDNYCRLRHHFVINTAHSCDIYCRLRHHFVINTAHSNDIYCAQVQS